MGLSNMKVSRRKFLATSGGALAAAMVAGNLTTLKSVASGGHKKAAKGEMGEKFIPSSCEMCVNKCGFFAHVVNGRVKKLNPNPKFFKSRAMLCARGNAGAEEPYNPNRLKKPLLRVGKRGENKWKEISYQEAFKIVAEKMAEVKKTYENRSAMAFASSEGFGEKMFQYLVQSYGSTNTVRHPTLCLSSVIQGWSSVFGVFPDADIQNAEYVLMFGANRAQAIVTPDSIDIQKNRPKGQKIIYLDPRFTATATKADKWFPVKPGTDMAFVLALMNVIIGEELYDKDFVANTTHGFDQLKEHVKQYTPEWAEKECDISAADIREVAREFADKAPRALCYPGRRTSWYVNDVQFRRACAILTAICGSWDVPGGIIPKTPFSLNKIDATVPYYDMVEGRLDVESYGEFKNSLPKNDERSAALPQDECVYLSEKDGSWLRLRDAIINQTPYPVKAMMIYKQNFVEAMPNRNKTMKMLEKLDFICMIDIQMSDTAFMCDLVIPESTYLERWDAVHSLTGLWPTATFRQPVIKPVFDTLSQFEITGGIIEEMLKIESLWDDADDVDMWKEEMVDGIFRKPIQEYIKRQVSHIPGGYEKLLKEGLLYKSDKLAVGKTRKPGWRYKTKSGKIELASLKYPGKGLDALPTYRRPNQPTGEGQFRFILGRHAWNTHSGTQDNGYLYEIQPENELWINTAEAKKLGIVNGDYVIVKSSVGQQKVKALVTEGIRPDCVHYTHGFGRISTWMTNVYGKGASQAEILEDYIEPISGNAAMHETFVTVTKA